MGKLDRHWTESSLDAYLHCIATDWVMQVEKAMEKDGVQRSKLAKRLGVTSGRVSQVLNDPGNLTLKKIIEYARAIHKKVSIVCYDDGDPENRNGPVNSEIFQICWERAGRPTDFFGLRESQAVAANIDFAIREGQFYRWEPTSGANVSAHSHDEIMNVLGAATSTEKEMRIN